MARTVTYRQRSRPKLGRIPLSIWAFLGVGACIEAFWVVWPAANTFYYSFTDWDGIGQKHWIGLGNFTALLRDPIFGKAFVDTFIWLIGFGGLSMALGFIAALALERQRRGISAYRAIIYLPLVFSLVVTGLIWQTLYQPQGTLDVLMSFFHIAGLQTGWLAGPHTAEYAVLVAAVWHEVGYIMVLYLAGLKASDPELMEAAVVDGSTPLQRLVYVVIPQLREVTLIVLAIVTIDSFRAFDIVWVMTGGGPNNASQLLSTYMYTEAFTNLQFGYGSSLAVVIFLLTIGFVIFLVSRMTRRQLDRS